MSLIRRKNQGDAWETVVDSGGDIPEGTVWPVADPTGVRVDTTTYDNPITGSGKMATLVFPPGDSVVFALAQEGDAHPFFVIPSDTSDALIYFGENDKDPYNDGNSIKIVTTNSGFVGMRLHTGVGIDLIIAEDDAAIGSRSRIQSPFTIQNATISSGVGAPTGGANAGDIYIRTDPGGANETLYRCTVGGTAGNATWVGIL